MKFRKHKYSNRGGGINYKSSIQNRLNGDRPRIFVFFKPRSVLARAVCWNTRARFACTCCEFFLKTGTDLVLLCKKQGQTLICSHFLLNFAIIFYIILLLMIFIIILYGIYFQLFFVRKIWIN